MSKPVWVNKSSFLGTIPEEKYYSIFLEAYDSVDTTRPVFFEIVAGQPPNGIHLDGFGALTGSPQTLRKIAGVPSNVPQAVTSKFAVRSRAASYVTTFIADGSSTVYTLPENVNFTILRYLILVDEEFVSGYVKRVNGTDRLYLRKIPAEGSIITLSLYEAAGAVSDRTFTITVVGENAPEILSTVSDLGTYVDGTYFEKTIESLDLDTTDVLTFKIVNGELPSGITLDSETGIISGYFNSLGLGSITGLGYKNYTFTVSVSDGKLTDSQQYSIKVISAYILDASTTYITADATLIGAESVNYHIPVIKNKPGEIGPYKHNNYFLYKFDGVDFDGDTISYETDVGVELGFDEGGTSGFDDVGFDKAAFSLPPGLTLNKQTGWLYGYLPVQTEASKTYTFNVFCYKESDGSTITNKSITKSFSLTIIGTTQSGVVWDTDSYIGSISNGAISELYVKATANNNNTLYYYLASGEYNRLPAGLKLLNDGNISGRPSFSTFSLDSDYETPTTFDKNSFFFDETTFDQTRRFTVLAKDTPNKDVPGPTVNTTREFTIKVIRTNNKPFENLYIDAQLNLSDKTALNSILNDEDLIPSEDLYRPNDAYFGRSKKLSMLIANGVKASLPADYMAALDTNHYIKPLYFGDIKTARVLDENDDVKYEIVYVEINDDTKNASGKNINSPIVAKTKTGDLTLYPNNLADMRKRIFNQLGQENKALPDWMIAKQENNTVLGFTNACILAYVKPNKAASIAYRISRRALLESDNVKYFDFKNLTFVTDRYVWDTDLLANYDKTLGKFLTTEITTFDSYSNRYDPTTSIDGSTLIYPYGSAYVNDPNSSPTGTVTTFDKNSLRFTPYVDLYADPEERDKYLMFPKRNILS